MTKNPNSKESQVSKIIEVKVVSNAKITQVKVSNSIIKVYVNAPAIDGKANKAVIESLAKHYNIKNKNIEIIKGFKSKEKLFKILF